MSDRDIILKFSGCTVLDDAFDDETRSQSGIGANVWVQPPCDYNKLYKFYKESSALRTSIEAMAVNIQGLGYKVNPTIDLEDEDTLKRLRVLLSRQTTSEVTDRFFEAYVEKLRVDMADEKERLETFLEHAFLENSFMYNQTQNWRSIEISGNGYIEVRRDSEGNIAILQRLCPKSMRITKRLTKQTEYSQKIRLNPITFTERKVSKRFRQYVQIGSEITYFKEFGDPSVYSSKTGREYISEEELYKEEETAQPASEVLHFHLPTVDSPYGEPRWLGSQVTICGTAEADETNKSYFSNKGIPPMIITATGGRLTKDSKEQLRNKITNSVKGTDNFHKTLIIEAENGQSTGMGGMQHGQAKIDFKPMTMHQQNDGQFLEYIANNEERLGRSFRLPRLLRGDTSNINRSTAQIALKFAESQVFKPSRGYFDDIFNRRVFPDMGIKYHRLQTSGPDFRDPIELVGMVVKLTNAAALTPNEARQIIEVLFTKNLPRINDPWGNRPAFLTQSGVSSKTSDVDGNNFYEESFTLGQTTAPVEITETEKAEVKDILTKAIDASTSADWDRYDEYMDQLHSITEDY